MAVKTMTLDKFSDNRQRVRGEVIAKIITRVSPVPGSCFGCCPFPWVPSLRSVTPRLTSAAAARGNYRFAVPLYRSSGVHAATAVAGVSRGVTERSEGTHGRYGKNIMEPGTGDTRVMIFAITSGVCCSAAPFVLNNPGRCRAAHSTDSLPLVKEYRMQ